MMIRVTATRCQFWVYR